jgi:hypothetical protein
VIERFSSTIACVDLNLFDMKRTVEALCLHRLMLSGVHWLPKVWCSLACATTIGTDIPNLHCFCCQSIGFVGIDLTYPSIGKRCLANDTCRTMFRIACSGEASPIPPRAPKMFCVLSRPLTLATTNLSYMSSRPYGSIRNITSRRASAQSCRSAVLAVFSLRLRHAHGQSQSIW